MRNLKEIEEILKIYNKIKDDSSNLRLKYELSERYYLLKYGKKRGKVYTSIEDVDFWEKRNIEWGKQQTEYLKKHHPYFYKDE